MECNKYFKSSSTYRRHVRDYHSGINEQVWNVRFSKRDPSSNILLYLQHICELCDKSFKTKGMLINHKSAKHRDMPATYDVMY